MKLGWVSRGLGLLAVVASVAAVAPEAEACSPPESLAVYVHLSPEVVLTVPTDGVLAFRITAHGPIEEALALLSVTVVQGEEEVAGAIERVELGTSDQGGVEAHDLFIVWRSEADLVAGADYAAVVSVLEPYDPEIERQRVDVAITAGDGPAGALPVPVLEDATLGAEPVGIGQRVCCTGTDDSCGNPQCEAPVELDQAYLSASLTAGDDPMLSQAYARVLVGTDDALEALRVIGLGSEADGTHAHAFEEQGERYCIAVELVSLIDGTVGEPQSACVDHGELVLEERDNPEFAAFAGQCEGELQWEETGEPYEPGDGSESEGGSADSGSEDSGSEDGGNLDDDDTAKGCGCDVDERGSWVSGLLALVIGVGLRRRRRAA